MNKSVYFSCQHPFNGLLPSSPTLSHTCASFVKSNTCLFNIQRFASIVSYIWNGPTWAKLDSSLMSSAPSAFLIISALSNNDHWCFKQGIQAFDQVWVEALKGRMRRRPLDSRLHTLKARRPKTPAHKLPSAAAVHPFQACIRQNRWIFVKFPNSFWPRPPPPFWENYFAIILREKKSLMIWPNMTKYDKIWQNLW